MRICIVIPARYKSSRFPGKPLTLINGKALIVRVARIAQKVLNYEDVYVATDNIKIENLCKKNNIKTIFTSLKHQTGTDRLAEVSSKISYDYFINLQGDEPTVDPSDLKACIEYGKKYPNHVINFYHPIIGFDPSSRSIPKVVFNNNNDLIYISRSLIPGNKEEINTSQEYFRQVCIYGFNKNHLKAFSSIERTKLEINEDIEILRFFDLSIPIKTFLSKKCGPAVDYPEDISKVIKYLEDNKD